MHFGPHILVLIKRDFLALLLVCLANTNFPSDEQKQKQKVGNEDNWKLLTYGRTFN